MKPNIALVAGGAIVLAVVLAVVVRTERQPVPVPTPLVAHRRMNVPRELLARAGQRVTPGDPSARAVVERSELSPGDEFYYAKAGLEANIKLRNGELKLSAEQVALLVDDLAYYIELKAELDAERAKVSGFDGKKLGVTIPADVPLAHLLRDSLVNQIGQDLSPEGSKRVSTVLGDTIDAYFRNYGSMTQEFEVVRAPDSPQRYMISWSTAPLTSDPKTQVRGLLGDTAPRSRSAMFSLSAEELGHGEYRFLQPLVEKSLPADL